MWQLVGIVVWLPLYLFICLRYTHSCFPTAQFSGWARIILNWDCNCVGMDRSSCKAKWHTSIGPRKESGIRGCLTLLVKWVLYGFGDSGGVCPYAPVYLSHNTGPLLHAASEAGMGQAWRYQVRHTLGHLEIKPKWQNVRQTVLTMKVSSQYIVS